MRRMSPTSKRSHSDFGCSSSISSISSVLDRNIEKGTEQLSSSADDSEKPEKETPFSISDACSVDGYRSPCGLSMSPLSFSSPSKSRRTDETAFPSTHSCQVCGGVRERIVRMGVYLLVLALSLESCSVGLTILSGHKNLTETSIIKSICCVTVVALMVVSTSYLSGTQSVHAGRKRLLQRIESMTLLVVIVRAMIEIDVLATGWDTPILPKLSSTYCNMRLVSIELSAQCTWHSSWLPFRLKELAVIAVTAVGPVLVVKMSSRQDCMHRVVEVVKWFIMMLIVLVVFEGFLLPFTTLIGILQTHEFTDYPVTKVNLFIVVVGSILQLFGLIWVIFGNVRIMPLIPLVVGAFVSTAGYFMQLCPILHGPVIHASSTYQILVAEAVSRVLYQALFAVATTLCCWGAMSVRPCCKNTSVNSSDIPGA
eukprot:TRINITY_DN1484_c7_g1_i1.p1 TRINITY_DN1484_c7_g1~~TRINITY_DN1484_c7_g1_i1.p1  ORF type:complete len:425 (+),score=42.40 TRINITY_DN1484_c7_g1_i1:63-1337(+)